MFRCTCSAVGWAGASAVLAELAAATGRAGLAPLAAASGLALLAGSLATRFGVFEAKTSAADPRDVIVPQRARLAASRSDQC